MSAPFSPDPFVDREPWLRIGFGGVPITRCALTKINGVSTKHAWKEQKSKETSGSVNTFSGTTWSHPKLTFSGTESADFQELWTLWLIMKPVPGQGGTGSAGTPPPALALGSPAGPNGSTAAPSGQGGVITTAAPGSSSTKAADSSSTPNPGPRPPTISVDYPLLKWHEITACALEEWEGPYFTDTNGMEVTITIIPDKPPAPAGAGAMGPPQPGSQFAIGSGAGPGGGAGGSTDPVQKGAAAGAGGV